MSDTQQEQEKREEVSWSRRSFREKMRWLASAMFFPFFPATFPKLGVFLAAWSILQPAATMLFPRAEKVLEEEGLRPEIVQELAPGKKVYIRRDDFWGKMHAVLDKGPIWAPFHYMFKLRDDEIAAFTIPSVFHFSGNICSVYLKSKDANARAIQTLSFLYEKVSHGQKQLRSPLSPKERREIILLHEIRHCSDDNQRAEEGVMKEGDSDFYAVDILARETRTPGLKEAFLAYRSSLSTGIETHDTALYLDAQFRRATTPSKKEIERANGIVAEMSRNLTLRRWAVLSGDCSAKRVLNDYCNYQLPQDLPPLAVRRIKLYERGWDALLVPTKKLTPPRPVS